MVLKKHKTLQDGVKKAQDATRLQGRPEEDADMVNPRVMYSATPAPKGTHLRHGWNIVHMVDFDIAVTADSPSDAGGKLALHAGIGGIEGGGYSIIVIR